MRLFSKYLRLLAAFFRTSLVADMEFRANLAVKIFGDIVWYTSQLSVFEVLFRHTSTLGGWTLEQMRVFMGVLFAVDVIYMILFSENVEAFREKARKGDLDFLLAKPVNSQFMVLFHKVNTAYVINAGLIAVWLGWALASLPTGVPWVKLPMLGLGIVLGSVVNISLRFFFVAPTLIFTEAEALTWLWYQLFRMGSRPDLIYPAWLRYTVLTVIPVGFIASVPAKLVIEEGAWWWLALLLGLAGTLLFATTKFWAFALKRYSSASS